MTDRKQQPAQLKRRIAQLEGYLAAEKEANSKLWDGYRTALYELVDIRLKLESVERALQGDE